MKNKVIKAIQEKGWNKETKQLVREAVVNQPTGRFTYYDLHKCFHDNDVTSEHVCSVLSEAPIYKKHAPKVYRTYTEDDIREFYGNVLHGTEYHREFNDPDELIEFWCGTSITRARAFITSGNGYTMLERPVCLHNGTLVQYGIQVMLENFRAYDYAYRQAWILADKPGIIHGFIKAKYLFGANNSNEYGIPCEYYSYMENVEII